MSEVAQAYPRPEYVGVQPVEYKGLAFGLERVSTAWQELIALGAEEWEEVGDDERIGEFIPDYITCFQHEQNGNLGLFSIRALSGFALVGYFVGTVGAPLKTKGVKVFNEVGVYLRPEYRLGRAFLKFMSYVEAGAKHFGCEAIIVSHRPEHDRIGRLYQRLGYTPLSHDYLKRLP